MAASGSEVAGGAPIIAERRRAGSRTEAIPGAGARRMPLRGAGEVADRPGRVEARLEAELLPHPPVVDAPAEAQQPDRVAVERPGAEPIAEPGHRRREQRVRERNLGPARDPQRAGQRDRAVRSDVDRAADRVQRCREQRAGRVVGVDELKPRVEAELRRHRGQRQVASERGAQPGPDLGLVAEHAAGQVASGGGRSSRSSPRARRCRAGSGCAAGSCAPSPR